AAKGKRRCDQSKHQGAGERTAAIRHQSQWRNAARRPRRDVECPPSDEGSRRQGNRPHFVQRTTRCVGYRIELPLSGESPNRAYQARYLVKWYGQEKRRRKWG